MKHPPDRRTVLIIAAAVAVAAISPAAANPAVIDGAVAFKDGQAIPKGSLEIYLEDPAIADTSKRRVAETRVDSTGKSKTIAFALPPLASPVVSPTLRVVARLERADGWLLARGEAPFEAGSLASIILNTVMY